MRITREITAIILGLFGVALIVRGAWGGVWPVSVQLIAGLSLIAYAYVRWRRWHVPHR
jgi:hypothetical protein